MGDKHGDILKFCPGAYPDGFVKNTQLKGQ